jgi:hypothetical protein
MPLRCSSTVRRGTVAAVLAAGLVGLGAPAAAAAEDSASGLALGAGQHLAEPPPVIAEDVAPLGMTEAMPATAGLGSGSGWVQDVRAASADSTAAVAGGVVLLVAGGIAAVAVRPRRRPPAQG